MEKVQSIGFIGGGMMAGAILDGMVNRMKKNPTEIFVSERRQERCDELHDMYGVSASTSADSFIGNVDAVLLAVKPQALDAALDEIASKVKSDARIISIVAGVPLARLEKAFPGHPIVRVMPNTPLSVGEGMSAYTFNDAAEAVKDTTAEEIFSSCGKAVKVAESLMDAVTGLSGSGPAYALLMHCQTAVLWQGFHVIMHESWRHRLFWVPQKWYLRQESILMLCGMRSLLLQERLLQVYVLWSSRGYAVPLLMRLWLQPAVLKSWGN